DVFDQDVVALLIGARPETGESPAVALGRLTAPIDDASRALGGGDVQGAIDSYTRFDDGWAHIEDGVREKSRNQYRAIETGIVDVRATLLRPTQPDPAAAGAALTHLRQIIDAAVPDLR